jgi:hypothetical protein
MANSESSVRTSNTVKHKFVSNGATVGLTTTYAIAVDEVDVESYENLTVQFRNADSNAQTAQVWGSLYADPATVGTTATPASSYWVQIGDDITVAATGSTLKSVSTTGLRKVAVRVKSAGSYTMPVDQVLMFIQGRV